MAVVQRFGRAMLSGERFGRRTVPMLPDMEELYEAVIQAVPVPEPAAVTELPRDHDTACDILDRAAAAFDQLTERIRTLETELAAAEERQRGEAESHAATTASWSVLADGMKAHARDCEQRLADMTARAETAEAAAVEAIRRAEAAEEQFALLQGRSTRLHDKVVASFGIGSRAQLVFDRDSQPGRG